MIPDVSLNNMAALLKGDTVVVPSHLTFGTTVITPSAGDTTLDGETGSRIELSTPTRTNNIVFFEGIRTGAIANDEYLNATALFNSTSGGTLYAEATMASVLHTTTFDIEVDWRIEFNRK